MIIHCQTTLHYIQKNYASLTIRAFLICFFTIVFYQIGSKYMPYSGDGGWIANEVIPRGRIVMHSPLSSVIQKIFYFSFLPFGMNSWHAISLCSAFAGAIAIQVYFAFTKNYFFLMFNIFSGSFLVFVGQVENYAWVNLFLILSFYATRKFLDEEWRIWPAFTFFFLAALCHFMTFFYLPAMFWVLYQRKKFDPIEFVVPLLCFLFLHFLFNFVIFEGIGIDFNFSRIVPLFHKTSKLHHFTFFTWDHAFIKYYFHVKAAFPILPIEWPNVIPMDRFLFIPLEWPLLFLLRSRINTDFRKFLLICSITGLAWTSIWHPDLGPIDWDLFSQMGIPLHLLLGYLLFNPKENQPVT